MEKIPTMSKYDHQKNNQMKKLLKLSFLLLVLPAVTLLLSGCEDYEDKLTGKNPSGDAVDISSKISGFASEVSGAGATLTVLGNDISGIIRVYFPSVDAYATNIEASDSEVSFTVPLTVPLGEQELNFIFSGSGRATASIEMVPLPVIDYWDLQQGDEGDDITVYGTNLDFVTSASIGGVDAAVTGVVEGAEFITVTVPTGAMTGPLTLVTPAGTATGSQDFVVCSTGPENPYCLTPLNGNFGFEDGTIGVLGEGGDIGGGGFTAGSPGAQWEIIPSPGGAAGLGNLSLSVTVNELQNSGVDAWRIQYVNNGPAHPAGGLDGFQVEPDSRFTLMVKIWADQNGRMVFVQAGRRTPCCGGFTNGQEFTLSQGWNIFQFETQHSAGDHDGDNDEHAAMEVNVNYPANLGGQIIIDDLRLVKIGDYL